MTGHTLNDVLSEMREAIAKHGDQSHVPSFSFEGRPDLRPIFYGVPPEKEAKTQCRRAFAAGHGSWCHIFLEEVCEAIGAETSEDFRAELVQVAAMALQWLTYFDRQNRLTKVS